MTSNKTVCMEQSNEVVLVIQKLMYGPQFIKAKRNNLRIIDPMISGVQQVISDAREVTRM